MEVLCRIQTSLRVEVGKLQSSQRLSGIGHAIVMDRYHGLA